MLPVMATVVFKPGVTVMELAERPKTKALWAELRGKPGSAPPEQWRALHDAALELLTENHAVAREQVAMHCEVQLMFEEAAKLRCTMHEIYKVTRAESGTQLFADLDLQLPEGAISDLCIAAHLGMPATVARLIRKCGGEFENNLEHSSTQYGETAVYCASEKGHLACLLHLLEAGARPDAPRNHGDGTPLYIAAQEGHLDVVLALLRARADPNLPGKRASAATPLHAASNVGHRDVVHALLASGANPNVAKSDDGVSPLFFAAQRGHLEVVQSLLASNADAAQPAADGRTTPIVVANHRGHVAIVEALILSIVENEERQMQGVLLSSASSSGSDGRVGGGRGAPADGALVAAKDDHLHPLASGSSGCSGGGGGRSGLEGNTVGRVLATAQYKQQLGVAAAAPSNPKSTNRNVGSSSNSSSAARRRRPNGTGSGTSARGGVTRPLRKVGTSGRAKQSPLATTASSFVLKGSTSSSGGSGGPGSSRGKGKGKTTKYQKEPAVRRKWTKKLPAVAGSTAGSANAGARSNSTGSGGADGVGARGGSRSPEIKRSARPPVLPPTAAAAAAVRSFPASRAPPPLAGAAVEKAPSPVPISPINPTSPPPTQHAAPLPSPKNPPK